MKTKLDLKRLSTPKDILLADPIRDVTRINKRNLLFFSTISLIATAYGSDSIQLPYTTLPTTVLTGVIGCVILYLLISYLVNYVTDIQAWQSVQRNTIEDRQLKELQNISEKMSKIVFDLDEIPQYFEEISKNHLEILHNSIEPLHRFIEYCKSHDRLNNKALLIKLDTCMDILKGETNQGTSANKALLSGAYLHLMTDIFLKIDYLQQDTKKYRKIEKSIKRETLQLYILQNIKMFAWEGILPIFLAIFAVYKISDEISKFVTVLI